jgi:hypothetical protein
MELPPINVLIPLGGLGTRFQKEGYLTRPKPFVRVLGKEMILWVLDNLKLRSDDGLVLVFDPSWMSMGVFMREIVGEKYPQATFVELGGPTRGAAETVLLGLRGLPSSIRSRPTLLADGDTFYTADVVGRFREVSACPRSHRVPSSPHTRLLAHPLRDVVHTGGVDEQRGVLLPRHAAQTDLLVRALDGRREWRNPRDA